jgi:putative addiction module killer protein
VITIKEYVTKNGRSPFRDWLKRLDQNTRGRINARLTRLSLGNLGDMKNVGAGVVEFRLDFGPGYRIYAARQGDALVILLCGGDKSSQTADIRKAQSYWKEYLSTVRS